MSNALNRVLMGLVEQAETNVPQDGRWRQRFHVMPPVGWMNDPNGLCQVDGVFHVYFQYAPLSVTGGFVYWGHATSRDLVHWEHDGSVLAPDTPYDCHGVYSGCAVVRDGKIAMFYTGNVKLPDPDGTFDYVNTGRVANTLLVETTDGTTFGPKRLLMTNADYPADDTCHVRDPYVWFDDASGRYLMLQGARRRGEGPDADADRGEVLVFASEDLLSWELVNRVSTPERFGYMWECPGYVELPTGERVDAGPGAGTASALKILSVSPQGLEGGAWDRRNVFQSGYFPLTGDIAGDCELGTFRLWDAGFDFYAPQVFWAEDGRALLIGWMGMPNDEHSYSNEPTMSRGWQHCLTFPRELTAGSDGTALQTPARELEALRGEAIECEDSLTCEGLDAFDLEVSGITGEFSAALHGGLSVAWLPAETTGEDALPARLELRFTDAPAGDRSGIGCGRTVRWEPLERLTDIRVVADASSVEVFANGGSLVMSTRCYPTAPSVSVQASGAQLHCWSLQP